jgi:death on curing protein
MSVRYLTLEDVLEMHAIVVRLSGGSHGVRSKESLLGSLERPKAAFGSNDMYPTLFAKAAVYIDSIARNHPFVDGNKRSSFLCAARFLAENDIDLIMGDEEIVRGVVWVVVDNPSIKEIAAWLEKHVEI